LTGNPFVHLHVRSGFSFGFGVARPEELVGAAAELGMPALALTDRDGLYGIPRFLEAAGTAGVLPIVGVEVSTAEGHLVLLAGSMEGYRSLCRLVTEYRTSSEDRRRPVCPLSAVIEHTEGVICLTGAVPFGVLPRLILNDHRQEAMRIMRSLSEAFGRDRLYVELTDDQTAAGRRNVARVAAFAQDARVPVVVTGEVAYLSPADHRLHEVLVASANLTALPGPEYRPTDRLHLRSVEEMRRLFAGYPEALANAARLAERCAGTVDLSGTVHMPQAILPPGKTAGKMLLELTVAGARRRYRKNSQGPDVEEIKARLRRELSCIDSLGFAPYFLLAREAREIAKSKGIPVTGRGSAANSLARAVLEPSALRALHARGAQRPAGHRPGFLFRKT
jgi:error-prone DNA polymerase